MKALISAVSLVGRGEVMMRVSFSERRRDHEAGQVHTEHVYALLCRTCVAVPVDLCCPRPGDDGKASSSYEIQCERFQTTRSSRAASQCRAGGQLTHVALSTSLSFVLPCSSRTSAMGRFLPRLCSPAAAGPGPALCFPLARMPLLLSVCRPATSASSSANDIKSSCPWKPPPLPV